jgi:hypothetical protein
MGFKWVPDTQFTHPMLDRRDQIPGFIFLNVMKKDVTFHFQRGAIACVDKMLRNGYVTCTVPPAEP